MLEPVIEEQASHEVEDCGAPDCIRCARRRSFILPEEVVTAAREGHLTIFAGAGVSTESQSVLPITLYDEVKLELGDVSDDLTFSQLMSRYWAQPDGPTRLLQKIKHRITHIRTYPELYRSACEFHRELATIPQLKNIITTNWDDLFEQECAATPFVVAQDFVFWRLPERKVFKIHGSVNNYSSIVATQEQYDHCYQELSQGLIGSNLKMLLATQVVVFVGYSLRDDDFQRVLSLLSREMGELLPHAYIVTLDETTSLRYPTSRVTPIVTDAVYFVEVLKARLVADRLMIPDEQFDGVDDALFLVHEAQDKLTEVHNALSNPEIIYAMAYQDGLIHRLEIILANKKTASYSDPCQVFNLVDTYQQRRRMLLRGRRYFDVAYIDGHIAALTYFMYSQEGREGLPLYYAFGAGDVVTLKDYMEVVKDAHARHKAAYELAKRVTGERVTSSDTVVHHGPIL